ncbi:MAG: 2-hydroxyglutaryl-CoA dehydratase, partial [Planctomycetes bacterium]|nr:2-hydroxyglutaryl-CoA dehydratase [Planctomycetota bacterium]
MITAGIDVGSTYTKAILLDENDNIVGKAMCKTGFRLTEAARRCFDAVLEEAGKTESDVEYLVATGYGRDQVDFKDLKVTDLTASARGARLMFPGTRCVLDVGGQTMKAIRLEEDGKIKSFRMNDKCA